MLNVLFYANVLKKDTPLLAMYEGMCKHGLKPELIAARCGDVSAIRPCDLAVFWGYRRQELVLTQKSAGKDCLVIERGFIDRFTYSSCGYNGLNGFADFYNKNSPPDRAERYQPLVKSYHSMKGGGIVLLGQVPGDMSLRGLDLEYFYNGIIKEIRKYSEEKIYYRPHPDLKVTLKLDNVIILNAKEPLEEQLQNKFCAVTYNSNSAVDCVLNGFPVVVLDKGCMAYPVANNQLYAVTDPLVPDDNTRQQWLSDLAYSQWLECEIRNGDVWERLKQRYN